MAESDRNDPAPEQPTSAQDELARLREENERLRAQLQHVQEEPTVALERPGARGLWRPIVATICVTLAIVLAPLSVVAVWADDQLSNTDRYIETVTPLAEDPAVQTAVINRITREIVARLNLEEVTTQLVDTLSAQGLPPTAATALKALQTPLENGVRNFIRTQVSRLVHSQTFQDAWVTANRTAHTELVAVLSGEGSESVSVEGGTVSVQLATFIETVKQALVNNGFELAGRIPTVNASFTVLQSRDLEKAQTGYSLLDRLGTWLPFIALLFLAIGVYVARGHRRTLLIGALGVCASMLVLGLALAIARSAYLDALPETSDSNAAAVIFDTLVRFLRLSLRTVLVLFLVVAVAAFLTGPSVSARTTRGGLGRAIGAARGGAESAGLNTGRFGAWVYQYRTVLRFVAAGIVALIYVFLEHPTAGNVIVLALVLLLVLALIEFFARPPAAAAEAEPEREPAAHA